MADSTRNDTPEKHSLISMDVSAEKRDQFKEVFPSVFTETRNEAWESVESVECERGCS